MEREDSLLLWVNGHWATEQLEEFRHVQTLIFFLQQMFHSDAYDEHIPRFLRELKLPIPFDTIPLDEAAYVEGDTSQIVSLLHFIQKQYQAYCIQMHLLNTKLTFSRHFFIPNDMNDIKAVLLSWLNEMASLYSFMIPLPDKDNWQNGIYLLVCLHYHHPILLSDLDQYLTLDNGSVLNKAYQLIYDAYNISCTPDADETNMMSYYIERLIPSLFLPNELQTAQREQDIGRFKSTTKTTTTTATYSYQQLRLTKTTKYTAESEAPLPTELQPVHQRCQSVTEKMASLQQRLELIVPTRNNGYAPLSAHSVGSECMDLFLTDDNTTHSGSTALDEVVKYLHPLQAAEEDYAGYDRHFKALQAEFQTLTDGDYHLLMLSIEQLEPGLRQHPFVLGRQSQVTQLFGTLNQEFEKSDMTLSGFRRGFAFARIGHSIRKELEFVQNKMVKSITCRQDIQELEQTVEKTAAMVDSLQFNFSDLLQPDTCEDPAYAQKYASIEAKHRLVKGWVDEVHIWFSEAERIRQWTEIRIDQIHRLVLPDPLSDMEVARDQVDVWNAAHSLLESEIDDFNTKDMARLRSHVKTLTGSGRAKDLSPADTTTIEITLTTLMALENLKHLFKQKSIDLQSLTRRLLWEDEHKAAMAWLAQTEIDLDRFLSHHARWSRREQDEASGREKLMARERARENAVQQLLTLERQTADFDHGQFTRTVESFQDIEPANPSKLPHHLESRQEQCERRFEDLTGRMRFARQVVEQRLGVMDFLHQAELVTDDSLALTLAIREANLGESDREMTSRVQSMHERIIQLVTTSNSRIHYDLNPLPPDQATDAAANKDIKQVVDDRCESLLLLGESLDAALKDYREVLQMHRYAKDHTDHALRLYAWAEDRIQSTKRAKVALQQDTFTLDDLQQLERECQALKGKLENGKVSEVVELITRIQLFLDSAAELKAASIDSDGLNEASTQLEESFNRLQKSVEDHALELDAVRKKLEDGHSSIESARDLRSFMSDTRLSLPALKQTCGFITGQSQTQDQDRYSRLQQSLQDVQHNYRQRQSQYRRLCARIDEGALNEIETEWQALGDDIQRLAAFSDRVGQWHDRQRRLSQVGNDVIHSLHAAIDQVEKDDEGQVSALREKIKQAASTLAQIGTEIHEAKDNENQEPVQIANYSCAKDRHSLLVSKLQSASAKLDAFQSNADTSLAFSQFLADADTLLNFLQNQKDQVHQAMTHDGQYRLGQALGTTQALETLSKAIFDAALKVESESAKCCQTQMKSLLDQGKQFEPQSSEKRTALASLMTIQESIQQLKEWVEKEKQQAKFVKKMGAQSKAAEDIQVWMGHCQKAISQLPTDLCVADEQDLLYDLEHLEQKMAGMLPTLQEFQAMSLRMLKHPNGPVDVCALSLDREQVKQAVEAQEAKVMQTWQGLQTQLAKAKVSVDQSKRGVEAARKVKAILVQVGDLKDRVNAVRICRNRPADQDDLDAILNCLLTDIPNEHRLASAKAELSILDRDMESSLMPAIKQLDAVLQTGEDMFEDQRKEITSAARSLMDLLKSKRRATSEAEKMQDFLTVMEEVEVLLLALAEVVTRASPDNARTHPDGSYLRTDLQALLIDLDTRYRYYEPKIIELVEELKQVAEGLMDDSRVVACLEQFSERWRQLQAKTAARKEELTKRIGPLVDSHFDYLKATEGMLLERGRRANKGLNKRRSAPVLAPEPKPTLTTPRYMTGYNRKPAQKTRTLSPTAKQTPVRSTGPQKGTLRRSVITPDAYVADPQNDLDVAVGDIVNDSPYKVKIKMVPGEVGKYWFGEVNPKLAYCRILRSRMVMVRVGGGWVELSQFLRDHALLECDNVAPNKAIFRSSLPPPSTRTGLQEGYLNVATIGRNTPIRRTMYEEGPSSVALMKESRSTPYYRGMTPLPTYGNGIKAGIKAGNKFLVTDDKGNQVQVKMTKANDAKYFTPRRINI
ncbi:hypothetical protein BY458DRAFT_511024 [Sporodiniella umbellata]|nr:hypothetical protein BY458DRAFT_511024 [Sporodiniella umbellata]